MASYKLNVNGKVYTVSVADPEMPLLWVLRDKIGLTGTKYGCGIEVCGACTVMVDGQPEKSCDMSVKEAIGRKIVTVEGLAATANGAKAQAAWVAKQVPQCGFCQSGMLVSTTAAMNAGKKGAAIVPELNNLCVCGTYARIKDAAKTL